MLALLSLLPLMFAYDESSLRPFVLPLNVLACVEKGLYVFLFKLVRLDASIFGLIDLTQVFRLGDWLGLECRLKVWLLVYA